MVQECRQNDYTRTTTTRGNDAKNTSTSNGSNADDATTTVDGAAHGAAKAVGGICIRSREVSTAHNAGRTRGNSDSYSIHSGYTRESATRRQAGSMEKK
jgi:hypothetical protein